jgi:hypothetical protein
MVLPGVEHNDRLSLRHAMVDLISVDGHTSHGERQPPRIAHERRDANQGA